MPIYGHNPPIPSVTKIKIQHTPSESSPATVIPTFPLPSYSPPSPHSRRLPTRPLAQVASKDGYVSSVIFEMSELGPTWDLTVDSDGVDAVSEGLYTGCCVVARSARAPAGAAADPGREGGGRRRGRRRWGT